VYPDSDQEPYPVWDKKPGSRSGFIKNESGSETLINIHLQFFYLVVKAVEDLVGTGMRKYRHHP
jgi:hypothetical protein